MGARVISGIIGAVVFGLLVPLVVWLTLGIPFDNVWGLVLLFGVGVVGGAVVGALFPRVFQFLFEAVLES